MIRLNDLRVRPLPNGKNNKKKLPESLGLPHFTIKLFMWLILLYFESFGL